MGWSTRFFQTKKARLLRKQLVGSSVLVVLLLAGCTLPAVDFSVKDLCVYSEKIGDKNEVPLCSTMPTSASQRSQLTEEYEWTKTLYPEYVADVITPFPRETQHHLSVYVVTHEELNSADLFFFRRETDTDVVGLFFSGSNSIYVTDRVFTPSGSGDFVHELAHWYSRIANLFPGDRDADEVRAYGYEEYYRLAPK